MKRITIYDQQVGLVYRNRSFMGVRTSGKHWLGWGEEVVLYDRNETILIQRELSELLANDAFRAEVELVEVQDNQLCLHFQDGNFKAVLKAGRYIFWRSNIKHRFEWFDLNNSEVSTELDGQLMLRHEIQQHLRSFDISAYEEGLLLIDGKLQRKLVAGRYHFWYNRQYIEVLKADLRRQQIEISGQEMLTADKASLRINFSVQYKIVDTKRALLDTKQLDKQLYLMFQMALREYVGTLSLDELLIKKEAIKNFVLASVTADAQALGVELLTAGIRDVILTGEMKEIMNQVLVAEKQAQANVIRRREETATTRSLLNTAKLMEDNPMLQKLKELEYIEKIADKISTISVGGGSQVLDQLKQLL